MAKVEDLHSVLSGVLWLVVLAGGVIYAGLVWTSYLSDGRKLRPRVDWRDPAHSAGHLAVWLGVIALTVMVRVGTPIFRMLSEASADVGDWFLTNRRHETR
jgi:hypothetical protein